jgi:aquaporin related protein
MANPRSGESVHTVTKLKTPRLSVHRDALRQNFKSDCIAAVGEFVGTVTFLLLGLGGIQASATSNQASAAAANDDPSGSAAINTVASVEQLTYIAASMGLSLLFSAWIFFRVTGAAFNPNVSFALFLVGVLSLPRFILYCIAQFLGAIVASAILKGLLPGPLVVTPALGAGTSSAQGVFIEMFATTALILSVFHLAVEKHRATFLAPVGIGLTLFAGHLWAVVYTGASMNTARAFGPALITGFDGSHWIYWLGPTLGSLLATVIFASLKYVKYWRLVEGQDTDVPTKSPSLFVEEPVEGASNRPSAATAGKEKGERIERGRGDNIV